MKTFILMAFVALLATLALCLLAGASQPKPRTQTLQLKRGRVRFLPLSMIERAALPFVTGMKLLFGGLSPAGRRAEFFNIAEGVHEEGMSKAADAALTARFLLVKPGSDADHIAVNGAADKPSGIATDEAEDAEDLVNVASLNATDETRKLVASEAIAHGADLYTAASGKVQDEPAVAGTYWRIGKARQAASANNDVIEAETHSPIKVVVIAALTSTDGTAAGAADLAALKVEAEKIGDDVRALGTALATPAEVKVLS